ncbi:hypothetical protein Ahy_B10g105369 [Arachis hypogaea]|uniref:NB-ARC domain-containing protein n=1 Tax=Arachis hypogaea TaxID=3818 RepID=A0A444X7U1_ARAHY|nr:hypothetical protein Ahy_B10g105369 [Arachis hypogaea]
MICWIVFHPRLKKETEVVTKLEDINERLDYAEKSKDIVSLKENARESLWWRIPSTYLLERSTIYDAKTSVIDGMGGVGKSIVAELKITKNMIEAVNSSRCDMKDLGFLQLDLKEKLMGKKYLVILDGV